MDVDWTRIATGLRAGRYNLLLGAGASLDSQSGSKNPQYRGALPGAGKLRADLSAILPDIRSDSSLNRLYRHLSSPQVQEHITDRFSGCTPGDTARKITEFRWRRIFTLNIDDALENAYSQAKSPIQKSSSVNFVDSFFDNQDKSIIPIIHLHGFARKPSDGYVFDIKEYMKSINDNNLWMHILGNLIRTEPFLVLGTSLEEPDITYFLADRDANSVREDRAPSVMVEPFPDGGTLDDCKEYALSLYKGTAFSFLCLADEKVPNRPSVLEIIESNLGDLFDVNSDPAALSVFHSDFERVPTILQPQTSGANFALGHLATWSDIQQDYDTPRGEQTNRFRNTINASTPLDVCLLLGEPGTGKSTILKRLALDFAQMDSVCLWRRASGRVNIDHAAYILKDIKRSVFIFVDNFADYAAEVSVMRKALERTKVIFVGAERNYRAEHAERILGGEKIRIGKLGNTGANMAERLIEAYVNLGLSTTKKNEKTKFANMIANDPIAVACCRIMNNYAPLDRIIERSLLDASINARRCYLIVALAAYCLRDGIQYDILSKLMRGYAVESQMDDTPLPIAFHDLGDVELIVPLNESISASVLRRSSTKQAADLLWTFKAIAGAIRPYVNLATIRAGHPSSRLAARLFDYDEVVKEFLGFQAASIFYEDTRKQWAWNSRYWHQFALMKLDAASRAVEASEKSALCDLAVQHARHAKTIEARHQFTLTTIGKVLFGKMEVLGKVRAADMDEAVKALSEAAQIERQRNRLSVHPFMVLFGGIISANALGATYSHSQRLEVLRLAREAIDAFPLQVDLKIQADKVLASLS